MKIIAQNIKIRNNISDYSINFGKGPLTRVAVSQLRKDTLSFDNAYTPRRHMPGVRQRVLNTFRRGGALNFNSPFVKATYAGLLVGVSGGVSNAWAAQHWTPGASAAKVSASMPETRADKIAYVQRIRKPKVKNFVDEPTTTIPQTPQEEKKDNGHTMGSVDDYDADRGWFFDFFYNTEAIAYFLAALIFMLLLVNLAILRKNQEISALEAVKGALFKTTRIVAATAILTTTCLTSFLLSTCFVNYLFVGNDAGFLDVLSRMPAESSIVVFSTMVFWSSLYWSIKTY